MSQVKDFFVGPNAEEYEFTEPATKADPLETDRNHADPPESFGRVSGGEAYCDVRHIGDGERRARIARRHALAPTARVADPLSATRAVTVLHATEAATVYLALFARVDGVTVADVDRALYEDRTLVKQLAMRRTLFVFPRDLLPAAWGSASARVADQERRRHGEGGRARGPRRGRRGWLKEAREAVLGRLADGSALGAATLRERAARAGGQGRCSAAAEVDGRGVAGSAGARHARGRGADRPRPQRGPLAGVPPGVDPDGPLAR